MGVAVFFVSAVLLNADTAVFGALPGVLVLIDGVLETCLAEFSLASDDAVALAVEAGVFRLFL